MAAWLEHAPCQLQAVLDIYGGKLAEQLNKQLWMCKMDDRKFGLGAIKSALPGSCQIVTVFEKISRPKD
ncbi:hypothetical protein VP01_2395g2 [Puccinia sorghi]|uniref:Uncharacterized protein n=1 Tax=Puccinia sorghi TaxID=27349 RepID=A0A0L6V6R0_9BASI|nr:hypothetical protein VP01_2395g2 [Puccinia sorghi]